MEHIHGIHNFVNLNNSSPKHPRIMFVSSISSIAYYSACHPSATLNPEESFASIDYAVALPMGYGESKHVTERMLAIAAEKSGVKVDILRLGQAAGPIAPDRGSWNRNEWFPGLIQNKQGDGACAG